MKSQVCTVCLTAIVLLWFAVAGRGDVDEAREYVTKAQEHLAASDPLVVDNLLRLAEAALDDVPVDQQLPLKAEIDELRKQFESDALVRRARLLVQRLDRLFEEAETTLGLMQGGGAATLRRIEQLLSEPESSKTLGAKYFEKYSKRLTLFRRAHERKLQERGADSAAALPVEVEAPESDAHGEKTRLMPPTREEPSRKSRQPEQKAPQERNSTPAENPSTVLPPVEIYLFGGSLTNTSLFSRSWKLLVTLVAAFVGLVKANFTPLFQSARIARLRDYVSRVPMPMWGLLMTVMGLWWLFDGWIVYGLLVSTGMLGLALFTTVDALERVGLLGAPAAAGIRKLGLPIVATAVAVAVAHVFVGGAWVVV